MIRRSDLQALTVAVEEQRVLLVGTQRELTARLSALEQDNRRLDALARRLARAGVAVMETAAGSKPAAAE